MNQIFLKNYRKSIEIGAFQEERQILQDVAFHITVTLPDDMAVDDQKVDEILSYDVLVDAVENQLAAQRYELLEALAEDIAAEILSHDLALRVDIEIEKLARIDGVLGIRILREGKGQLRDSAMAKHHLFVTYGDDFDEEIVRSAGQAGPVIFMAMAHFEPIENLAKQHIQIHNLDAMAWHISEKIGLPVCESLTEAHSLLARGQSFVFTFGKAVFAMTPPLQVMNEGALLQWAQSQLRPFDVTILE